MGDEALERWRRANGTLVISDRTPRLVRGFVGVSALAFGAAAIPIWLSSEFPWWAKPIMAGLVPVATIQYFIKLATYRIVIVPFGRTVHIEEKLPGRSTAQILGFDDLKGVNVVESRDSDGDPYFVLSLALPHGLSMPLNEGHNGVWSHAACRQLNALFTAQ